jgi:hypothetical protein
VRGGTYTAFAAFSGGKAVAEGATLEARPLAGKANSTAAMATDPGSTIVLRRCQLRVPSPTAAERRDPLGSAHMSLQVGCR